ncbi:metalloregulator ArsR/SmtB family transcription factor [Alteromonas halophila]|uniref:Transcriptional regulator n=1 Tax=Alteromonas halophila TaxID=516698 RepID=A0A918MYF0_9ALTE|nr:metalloregulator ArsR/SmtB family transcription factor [Alteromonas halophila]GGW83168.1 transcriptional regulator [Alteromonas halophila]
MTPVTLFKCLSDQHRLQLLMLIHEIGEACVCDLMAALNIDQPKTSRCLADLRKCGLVNTERRGKWVFYRLADDLPDWAKSIIITSTGASSDLIKPALARLPADLTQCC